VVDQRTLQPWRLSRWVRQSRGVLEVRAGELAKTGTAVGDRFEMRAD
jgi:uncharacterized membrane protein (UPF0127 family)